MAANTYKFVVPGFDINKNDKSSHESKSVPSTPYTPYSLPAAKYTNSSVLKYILHPSDNTYLTLNEDESITFAILRTDAEKTQLWHIFYIEHKDVLHGPKMKNTEKIIEISPMKNVDMVIRISPDMLGLSLQKYDVATDHHWFATDRYNQYGIAGDKVYDKLSPIINTKFEGKISLYKQVMPLSLLDDNLRVSTDAIVAPIMRINGPVVSYDFDGVLHLSIQPDIDFHRSLNRATYHPINQDFSNSDLYPFKEYIEQLKKDHRDGFQIIIVTARPESSDIHVRKYLKNQGIENLISNILYISDKIPFLKGIKVIKHYDDSPKHIVPMRLEGINIVAVDPPLNRFWTAPMRIIEKKISLPMPLPIPVLTSRRAQRPNDTLAVTSSTFVPPVKRSSETMTSRSSISIPLPIPIEPLNIKSTR